MSERPHLLIVDDELLIRDLLYDYFSARDFEITVAENGQSALSLINEESFDTVILDIKMPDMDGLQLTEEIRSNHGDLPIILITGYPSVESAIEALRRKVDDYFVKPVNLTHLRRAVETAVDRQTTGGHQEETS
ncbi:MAG: response regulator [candidate division Zixibacteria bacterium]|nr:response regulator [candidate division Zixibacteria bacterium]